MNDKTIRLPDGMRPQHRRAVAEHLHQLAAGIEAELAIEAADRAAAARRREKARACRTACKMVAGEIEAGAAEPEAVIAVAGKLELDPAQLNAHWEIARRLLKAHTKGLRNRKIMRLAARGWTDAEIARKYKMHKNSVNRIISRQLARGMTRKPLTLVQDNATPAKPSAPGPRFAFTKISSSPAPAAPAPSSGVEGEASLRAGR